MNSAKDLDSDLIRIHCLNLSPTWLSTTYPFVSVYQYALVDFGESAISKIMLFKLLNFSGEVLQIK